MNTGERRGSSLNSGLASLAEITFDAVVTFDARERITYWNPTAGQLYGWAAQEVLGKTPAELFWPVKTPQEKESRKQRHSRMKRGETLRGKHKCCRKDGSSVRVQYVVRAAFDLHGKLSGYVAIYRQVADRLQTSSQGSWHFAGQDIAEREQAEQALHASEERYRVVIENALDAIIVTDPSDEGRVLSANSAACRMFGYSQEEFIGLSREDILDVADPRLGLMLKRRSQSGQVLSMEITYKRKDGTFFPGELSSTLYQGEAGELRAVAIIRDITERKQIETQLKEVAEKYATLFNTTSDGVWIHSLNGEILEVNDAYCRMSGYSRAELIHMSVSALEAVETPGQVANHMQRVIEAGGHDRFESRHRRKDGSVFDVDITALYLEREGGRIAIFVRDITGRKQAEQALRESEERYRHLVKHAPAGIYEIDPKTRRFVEVNDSMCQILGYTREELLALLPDDLLDAEGRERFQQRMRQTLTGEKVSQQTEYRVRARDGRQIWGILNTNVNYEAGKPRSISVIAHDITERKRAEEQLERSNQKINEILASIQDDFYVLDRNWVFVYANRQFTSKIGKEPEDFIGSNIWEMFPKHLGTVFEENLRAAMEERKMRRFEIPGQYTNAWYRMTAFPSPEGITVLGTDITENKQAEQALNESQRKYQDLIETTSDFIWEVDSLGRCTYCSPQMERLWGLKPEDMLGRTPFDAMPPESRDKGLQYFKEIAGSAVPFRDLMTTALDSQGNWIFLETSGVPFFDHEGRLLGYRGITRDVTERNRTRQQIFESNQRLLALMNALPVGVTFSDDPTCQQITGNPAALAQFEVGSDDNLSASAPASSAPGRQVKYFCDGRQITDADLPLQRAVAENREIAPMELNVHLPSGKQWWASVLGAPIHDQNDNVIGGVAVIQDISERKQAEDALAHALQEMRMHIDNSPLAVISFDPQFRIIEWSAGAERMFGWTAEEVLNKTVPDLRWVYEDDMGEMTSLSVDMLSGHVSSSGHASRNYRKDGSVIECEWYNSVLVDANNKVISMRSQVLNVTERKRAEDALREHQKQLQLLNETLEQKVRDKTEEVRRLASDVIQAVQHERHRISHILHDDLQQRIYAIQMQLTLLHDDLASEKETAAREVSDIEQQLTEILAVTRHLSIDLSPPILSGEGLLHAIDWLAAQMRQRYGLPIELQAGEPFAIADEALHVLLFNCVRELLFNVVKHAQASRAVVALQWADAGWLRIEVRDNGKGFPVHTLEQPANEEINEENGSQTGLGLVTIRHQLSLFGGRLEIQSEPGAGARVLLSVPIEITV